MCEMKADELKKYIGTADLSVIDAMQRIDENNRGILYIVDNRGKMQGSLSDGDIRRWIIKTGNLDATVGQVMYKNTRYLLENDYEKAQKYMDSESLKSVPVLNSTYVIKDILFYDKRNSASEKQGCYALAGIPIIIMAGGKGTRLYPYTKILPKPLIPIGEIPILERIIEQFRIYGANEFYITVNYKKEMIKSYFNELKPDYIIHYVEESTPLGTAGGIRLIGKKFDTPVIISNCDTLIEVDYGNLLDYHNKFRNDMTVVSALKNITIPYGVIHSQEQGIITSMKEKPCMSYFINTGMYIASPESISKIPKEGVYHMTDLAELLIANRYKVGMYPISESSFLDMGEFEEMKKMESRISKI